MNDFRFVQEVFDKQTAINLEFNKRIKELEAKVVLLEEIARKKTKK